MSPTDKRVLFGTSNTTVQLPQCDVTVDGDEVRLYRGKGNHDVYCRDEITESDLAWHGRVDVKLGLYLRTDWRS